MNPFQPTTDLPVRSRKASSPARPSAALCLVALFALAGCRIILSVDDKHYEDAASASGHVPSSAGAGGTSSASSSSGGSAGAGCEGSNTNDKNCGACGHDCLGGPCVNGACQPFTIFADTDACAFSMALPGDGYLYFTDYYPLSEEVGPRVWRMREDGTERSTLYDTQNPDKHPSEVAVDASHVFVTVYGFFNGTGSIVRMEKDGNNRVVLASGQTGPHGIALDETMIYFTSFNGPPVELLKMPKVGGAPVTLFSPTDAGALGQISLDDDYVYFADGKNTVRRVNKAGTAVEIIEGTAIAPGPTVVDDEWIYWHDNVGLWRKHKDGSGVAEPIVTGTETWHLSIDDTYIYEASPAGRGNPLLGTLRRVKKSGFGQAEEILDSGVDMKSVVVDDKAIYWAYTTSSGCRIGKLAK